MKYDSKKSKTIKEDEKFCPYCNSLNIKKYLYGEPTFDYEKDKYILGGCIISFDRPTYKCTDCGKDIYVDDSINIPGIKFTGFEPEYDGNDYIEIKYVNNDKSYVIKLNRSISSIKEIICSISFTKNDINSVYKIDGVQNIEKNDFDKYLQIIMNIINNWIDEFDNNKLIDDSETKEWSLSINTKDDQLSFSENKVPSNMNELKNIILELEELYKKQFDKNTNRKDN